jgi:translation initiation factor 2-alpha kinase 4
MSCRTNKEQEDESQQPGAKYSSRFLSDYDPIKSLGSGGFGIVLEARGKLVDVNYAVKRIPLTCSAPEKEKVMREVKSHARLNHQHVVRYYVTWVEAPPPGWQAMTDAMLAEKIGSTVLDPGWSATCSDSSVQGSRNEELSSDGFHSELPSLKASNGFFKSKGKEELSEFLYISMELCSGGTLKNWLETNKIRKPETTTKLFRQICSGIAYIHRQGLIHRDLKPQNIFLSDRKTVKIGDFGLATYVKQEQQKGAGCLTLSNNLGTEPYMAPEMKQSTQPYGNKVDIFSLGIILLELLFPMSTASELDSVVTPAKQFQIYPSSLETEWTQLLTVMLKTNPDLRPDAKQILRESPKTPKKKASR